ncbi:hypothetical protein A2635_04995 [Candidatus Peribacteria bacterium RIFCSPHIGHO2_01_FULL_51_9]|nr:MAG: hypothetical protein A2635_04995 [Candidatus Peribacteria bacterium RIFCSPHIGHO2_01_FULL_51_9]
MRKRSSFAHLSDTEFEQHLAQSRYGDFELTDAIRPASDHSNIPTEGWRADIYQEKTDDPALPVLLAAASREKLFDLFMDLLDPLGDEVDVVLETSHAQKEGDGGAHKDLYREEIDLPILCSTLYDYEDLLVNDGCTGIAVFNPRTREEIQFDAHKILMIYAVAREKYEKILAAHGIPHTQDMTLITEGEHIHTSDEEHKEKFDQLCTKLGMDYTSKPPDDDIDNLMDRLTYGE